MPKTKKRRCPCRDELALVRDEPIYHRDEPGTCPACRRVYGKPISLETLDPDQRRATLRTFWRAKLARNIRLDRLGEWLGHYPSVAELQAGIESLTETILARYAAEDQNGEEG